jgi:hypothetical protein
MYAYVRIHLLSAEVISPSRRQTVTENRQDDVHEESNQHLVEHSRSNAVEVRAQNTVSSYVNRHHPADAKGINNLSMATHLIIPLSALNNIETTSVTICGCGRHNSYT